MAGESDFGKNASDDFFFQENKRQAVLVVDDCPKSSEIMARIIREQGCEVVKGGGGAEALNLIRGREFDLVLLDILMPGVNGYEVLKTIKTTDSLRHVPVIMITGLDSIESAVKCIDLGAEDYLVKPFDPVLLKARVSAHLERKRLRDAELDYRRKIEEHNMKLEERVRSQVKEITERWKAEDELRKEKEKAEEVTRLKDKFIALISHDLRSPVASIIGGLNFLKTELEPYNIRPEHKKLVEMSISGCDNIIKTIDQLLDINRLQTGRIKPLHNVIATYALAKSVLESVSFLAKNKGIELVNEMREGHSIFADYGLFVQVMQNLISNSIKFCNKGDTITIFSLDNEPSTIAVRDTGVGIRQELLPDLFKSEVKTTTWGTAGEKGTGLGLPLCKEIMEAHGGVISVESEEGKGTTFYLRFPCAQPKVMIVDDDETHRFILRNYVKRANPRIEIMESQNGAEALSMLDISNVNMIVTDVNMPVMDGFELLGKIRENPKTKSIPVLVITSNTDHKVRDRALQLGSDAFLTKPVEGEDFAVQISALIQKCG